MEGFDFSKLDELSTKLANVKNKVLSEAQKVLASDDYSESEKNKLNDLLDRMKKEQDLFTEEMMKNADRNTK